MNLHDTERVPWSAWSLYEVSDVPDDIVIFMTCSVRENADQRPTVRLLPWSVLQRLHQAKRVVAIMAVLRSDEAP